MLHNRYKIHTCPVEKRSDLVYETTVTKAMQCTDKSVVHRDQGFMYY